MLSQVMDFENGKIQVFFGPQAYQAKDDLEKEIVDFIKDTKESRNVAVQELENPKIAEAIDEVSRRTRDSRPDRRIPVRVVVESSYLRESKAHSAPRSTEVSRVWRKP